MEYSHPADHNPKEITKFDTNFAKMLDFKYINFQSHLETLTKLKKVFHQQSVFGNENTEKHPIYTLKKFCEEKNVDLLLIEEEGKRHYVLNKDFNTFIYDHTLYRGRKHFCCCCIQAFSTQEKLKCKIKGCFKINGKKDYNA